MQVLVAAMNQTDFSLIDKMNIQTDVIVGNQCDRNSVESFKSGNCRVCYINSDGRGVGLNRNFALMRADADICVFADDDMIYEDGYENLISESFRENPSADVIIFNLKEKLPHRYIIRKPHKVGRLNYLRYGTARIAVKLKSIKENTIFFNLCFGGGTEHSHGEDNLFLTDCLNKGLKIYAVPKYIASLTEERESTWNKGYNEKYFKDQGSLYKAISKKWWKLLCLQDAIRHKRMYGIATVEAYKKMIVE